MNETDYRVKFAELLARATEYGLGQEALNDILVQASVPLKDIPDEYLSPFAKWRKGLDSGLECCVIDWRAACEALEAWLDQEESEPIVHEGDLCDVFLEFVEVWPEGWENLDILAVEHDGEARSLRWLLGQLWNCVDIMPSMFCDCLDMEQGSTYAQAVRKIKDELAR